MEKHSIFGKFVYAVIPMSIGLVWIFGPTLNAVLIGAALGALVGSVRGVLCIGEMNKTEQNPLLKPQAEASFIDNEFKIKFIVLQMIAGSFVCALYAALILGIALLFS